MPSSPDPAIWSAFARRKELVPDSPSTPDRELAAVLETSRARSVAAREAATQAERRWLGVLAEVAVEVDRLERALAEHRPALDGAGLGEAHDHLRHVVARQRDLLERAGMTLPDPSGWNYASVSSLVSVEGWRTSAELQEERVIEVREIPVLIGDTLLRRGSVVMGAPVKKPLTTSKDTTPQEGSIDGHAH